MAGMETLIIPIFSGIPYARLDIYIRGHTCPPFDVCYGTVSMVLLFPNLSAITRHCAQTFCIYASFTTSSRQSSLDSRSINATRLSTAQGLPATASKEKDTSMQSRTVVPLSRCKLRASTALVNDAGTSVLIDEVCSCHLIEGKQIVGTLEEKRCGPIMDQHGQCHVGHRWIQLMGSETFIQ